MKVLQMIILISCISMIYSCKNDSSTEQSDVEAQSQSENLATQNLGRNSEILSEEGFEKMQKEIAEKQEAAKDKPPTAQQKATGDLICKCLNDLPLFNKTIPARSQEDFNRLADNATAEEVKKMQNCHTLHMKPAIRPIKEKADRAIYGFKTRAYITEKCLDDQSQFWFYLGKYIYDKKAK